MSVQHTGSLEIKNDDGEIYIVGKTKNDTTILISVDNYCNQYRSNISLSADDAEKIARFLLSEVEKIKKDTTKTE